MARIQRLLLAIEMRLLALPMTLLIQAKRRQTAMAFLVIGGLITSTLQSLLVIPVVYRGVDDIVNWLHHLVPNRSETLTVGVDI